MEVSGLGDTASCIQCDQFFDSLAVLLKPYQLSVVDGRQNAASTVTQGARAGITLCRDASAPAAAVAAATAATRFHCHYYRHSCSSTGSIVLVVAVARCTSRSSTTPTLPLIPHCSTSTSNSTIL
jgi:hypothetical protein